MVSAILLVFPFAKSMAAIPGIKMENQILMSPHPMKSFCEEEMNWIEHMECVNLVVPTRTHVEYRETHREQLNEFNHKYYEENEQKEIERAKAYRNKNPEIIKGTK